MPFVTLPNARLHYVRMLPELGPAAPGGELLLVHGLAASIGFWYIQIAPALVRRNYSVTMLDLRGHGLSSMPCSGYSQDLLAKDLEVLLDTLGIDSAHVVAHSFGGCIALRFAFERPERVRSITLADVRLRAIEPRMDLAGWSSRLRNRAELGFAALAFKKENPREVVDFAFLDQLATLALRRTDRPMPMQKVGPAPFAGNVGRRAARRWLNLGQNTTARAELRSPELSLEQLSRINQATLLIYGEYSQALPTGLTLTRTLPRTRLELVKGVGHFFPITSPEKLVNLVDGFIKSNGLAV